MKQKSSKALNYLHGRMAIMNYYDSFGTIVLKNGSGFLVSNLFEYFRETWCDYMLAKSVGDTNRINDIMTETGGVLSNGEVDIKLDEIAAAVAIYKIAKKRIHKKAIPFDEIKEFFDLEEQEGDSN